MVELSREGTTFGRYVLLDKIGAGGMAEILRAKTFGAAGFEKEFAIKLILPNLVDDDEFVDMFINEAKIAVSLYHANIVQVFDLGQIEEQYYIAMEYVHGKDLLDVLARCSDLEIKLPFHIVLFITMEMLKGLDFAHRAKNPYGEDLNIVHRDVSPSNILISYAGDVKVGDFGVAKAAVKRSLTESGTLKGKVGYMSPEQVMGERIDARSDVFSAGIVFFEALSMRRLFSGGSDLNVMLSIRDNDIADQLDRAGPLPQDLQDIICKSMSRHREERYQSAGEFYQALVDFCFKHNIKITGADLSNFMRRLFMQDIEEEKARRLSDPQAPSSEASMSYPRMASASQILKRQIAAVEPNANASSSDRPRYRYRTSEGAIYGPMTINSLRGFIVNRDIDNDDRVSKAEGPFLHPAACAEIQDLTHSSLPSIESVPSIQSVLPSGANLANSNVSHVAAASANDSVVPNLLHQMRSSSPELVSAPSVAQKRELSGVVEEIKQNYTTYSGSFVQMSFPRLLARLHRIKSTGRLRVYRDNVEKSIFFQDGQIILVDSNLQEELLGTFLINKNVISNEQLQEGLARLSEWGGRLGDALVATGAVPAHEVFMHLSEQMRQKLLEVFTWQSGEFGYYENQEPQTHGYPLDVNCLETVVAGCREHAPFQEILRFYRSRINIAVLQRSPAPFSLESLMLRGNELRIANALTPGMTFKELSAQFTPAQRESVYRTVYLLHQVEWLTFEVTLDAFVFPDD